MTIAQPPASAADHLQPVHFRLASNDGTEAVFVAQIQDLKVVRKPVYQLTVTVASSVLSEAPGDLVKFLSQMRAGFALLPKPEAFDDEEGDAGEFDIATEIKIAPDLVRFGGPGPVDVEVVVETATGLNALPPGLNALLSGLPSSQDAVDKKDHEVRRSAGEESHRTRLYLHAVHVHRAFQEGEKLITSRKLRPGPDRSNAHTARCRG
jgi:hypothetical protein